MSSPSTNTKEVEKRIERLFSKFAVYYGHVWRSQFKSEGFLAFAKHEWQNALASIEESIMDKAILHCRELLEMPPTLPQFLGICRYFKQREEDQIIFQQNQEELERKPPSARQQAIAREYFEVFKNILTKKPLGEQSNIALKPET